MKGQFVVITGPSASGKSLLVDALLARLSSAIRLVTITTRAPRLTEKDGVDYFFVSRDEFERRRRAGEFFEHAEVYDNLYGSLKEVLHSFLEKFAFVFAIIDVQGAQVLKEKLPESLVIFIRPGSLEEIARRLKSERVGVSGHEIEKRIHTAEHELTLALSFDAVIVNRDGAFDRTLENALALLSY